MKNFLKKYLKMFIAGLICIILVIGIIISIFSVGDNGDGIQYQILKKRDLYTGVSCKGTVSSENITYVYNALKGTKAEVVNVEVGDVVKKGDVLCKYNTQDILDNINTIKSNISKLSVNSENELVQAEKELNNAKTLRNVMLKQSESNLAYYNELYVSAKTAYEKSKENYEKETDESNKNLLFSQMLQNQSDMMKWKRDIDKESLRYQLVDKNSQNSVDEAQYNVNHTSLSGSSEVDNNRLTELNNQIKNAEIVSPIDGIVTNVYVKQGALSETEVAFEIADTSDIQVNCEIHSKDILNVINGNSVEINYYGIQKDINYVETVEEVISDDNSSTGFSAIVDISNKNTELLLGMNVSAYIYTEKKEKVLSVAYDSILSDNNETYYIYVAKTTDEETYTIVKIPVEIGMETNYYTEVISDELKEGDYIICQPEKYLEGTIVNIDALVSIENTQEMYE